MVIKKFNKNRLKKIMQVGVDVTYIHTNFGGRDLSSFEDIATFKNGQFSLWTKWRMTLIWCVVVATDSNACVRAALVLGSRV